MWVFLTCFRWLLNWLDDCITISLIKWCNLGQKSDDSFFENSCIESLRGKSLSSERGFSVQTNSSLDLAFLEMSEKEKSTGLLRCALQFSSHSVCDLISKNASYSQTLFLVLSPQAFWVSIFHLLFASMSLLRNVKFLLGLGMSFSVRGFLCCLVSSEMAHKSYCSAACPPK